MASLSLQARKHFWEHFLAALVSLSPWNLTLILYFSKISLKNFSRPFHFVIYTWHLGGEEKKSDKVYFLVVLSDDSPLCLSCKILNHTNRMPEMDTGGE